MNFAKALNLNSPHLPALAVALSAASCVGCAGSSGIAVGSHPTSVTKANVKSLLLGYRQTVATTSLTGYGSRVVTHGQVAFDATLGLYYRVRLLPSAFLETMYSDMAGTIPAGSLLYKVEDATMTSSGSFSITSGPYAGLTGTYFQALNAPGFNGSMSLLSSEGITTDSQFTAIIEPNGKNLVTETNGVSEPDGYLQTERATISVDGTIQAKTTDSNSCTSIFGFGATLSGSGTISGKYLGLPARVTWTAGGNGSVTYADGSTSTFSSWQMSE